jgi:hypothetical protein
MQAYTVADIASASAARQYEKTCEDRFGPRAVSKCLEARRVVSATVRIEFSVFCISFTVLK